MFDLFRYGFSGMFKGLRENAQENERGGLLWQLKSQGGVKRIAES